MKREAVLTGQLDLLVLAVLARRPAHGYAVLEALRVKSGGLFDLPEGSLYPALYRLEHAGLLVSESRVVAGRTRRTYAITPVGRAALRKRQAAWQKLVRSIAAVMGDGPVPDHG
jgi:DNA-binding PadR family transcriptional regulator